MKPPKLVESINALSFDAFFDKYGPEPEQYHRDIASCLGYEPNISIAQADAKFLRGPLLDDCLSLVEATSGEDYRNSEIKWSAAKKRREMMYPDMKYILFVEGPANPQESLTVPVMQGFISFMVTYEDGMEVMYVYEVHLRPAWQGKSIGQMLMKVVEYIGRKAGLSKIMLTVFKSNHKAIAFYNRLGYREDEFSPQPRQLRNGTVIESAYVILSKALTDPLAVK